MAKVKHIVGRYISDKYDNIYLLGKKLGGAEDFRNIETIDIHSGFVIDLEDSDGVIDTIIVNEKTMRKVFAISEDVFLTEDFLEKQSQSKFTNMLLDMGLSPNDELRKVNNLL